MSSVFLVANRLLKNSFTALKEQKPSLLGALAHLGVVSILQNQNPTHSVPITDVIKDKPIIRVPGCPPIPEVMTGVITYMLYI